MTPNSKFDLDFITRTQKTTGAVLLIGLIFGMYYFGVYPALAYFSGGVWGMINLMMITSLVRYLIRPEGVDTTAVIILSLIKFPLLYVSGYFLMKVEVFDIKHLVYGFSTVLLIMVLKAAGRLFLGLDKNGGGSPVNKAI